MDRDAFWNIVDDARSAAADDEEFLEVIGARLRTLKPQELLEFEEAIPEAVRQVRQLLGLHTRTADLGVFRHVQWCYKCPMLAPGVHEVVLALVADAWSRTYRLRALTFAGLDRAVESRNGTRIVPDRIATSWPAVRRLPPIGTQPPAEALDEALQAIGCRYGRGTADFVAMQLEYPRVQAHVSSASSNR